MTSEFNLSDKINYVDHEDCDGEYDFIRVPNIKEFIKRLKDYFILHQREYKLEQLVEINEQIDKLAGDKLK